MGKDEADINRDHDDHGHGSDKEDHEIVHKWHGVPPAGSRAPPSRWIYILMITAVLLVEFGLWAVYRLLTADIYGGFGTYWFYLGHIVAAPLIHLGPILIFWVLIRRERFLRRSDLEDGKHMSFELGPFKMTRKFLLSAALVGLIGGVVWRLTEMIVSDTTSILLGGSRLGTMSLFNLYAQSKLPLFLLMTFVMFFVVGPVEEFEFRSFVHDQSQRVLPKWQALVFSSIFFGLSHIPIAIFIYKLTPLDFVFAEISWMTAGAVFGALYMWSRNIFACILMHGIGNWQLAVYLWQSDTMGTGLTAGEMRIVSLVTSIVANAALILVFYLVHKYYWEPQRRGEAALGGRLYRVQALVFSFDSGEKKPVWTGLTIAVSTLVLLSLLVGGTVGMGAKDTSPLLPEVKVKDTGVLDLSRYETVTEVTSVDVAFMNVGDVQEISVASSEIRILKKVILTVTWTDETSPPGRPRVRPYTNEPDSFSASLLFGNSTVTDLRENAQGQEGRVRVEFDVNETDIISTIGNYTVDGTIRMEDAGIWTTIGFLGLRDDGNTCSYNLEVDYLVPKQEDDGGSPPKILIRT